MAQVHALAPDASSLAAAGKMLGAANWPLAARSEDGAVVWGEAQGSGSAPYRLSFAIADLGYKCSCPSRKFPCKHVLALIWRYADNPAAFSPAAPPPWVADWLARRRPTAAGPPAADREAATPAAARPDPVSEAEAAARRAATQLRREAGIAEALDTLDIWIGDQVQQGLASFPQRAQAACRAAAQRLVDGKAPGLALVLDELPATLFGLPDPQRPGFVVTELARLHLAAAAYRRQDLLPGPLRADVRRFVGWQQRRDELLADPAASRHQAVWTVLGTRTLAMADKLRRVETWLAAADGVRAALLVDFIPGNTKAAPPFGSGERFEAELVFYPSPVLLRAMVVRRGGSDPMRAGPPASQGLPEALAAHQVRLAALPWLHDDLLLAADARLCVHGGAPCLTDPAGTVALPLAPRQAEVAAPLRGQALAAAAGVWDGRMVTLLAADTELGPWFHAG